MIGIRGNRRERSALGIAVALIATAVCLLTAASARADSISGSALAGGKPLAGSEILIRQAGTEGSSQATTLATATSAGNGSFSAAYAPVPDGGPLYAIARGGVAGQSSAGRKIRLMAVLGRADDPIATVTLNEQSTVASAYALAQFLGGIAVDGAEPGLSNAADTAANLFEARAGKVSFVLASSPNGNATETLAKFNTVANALARCTRGDPRKCRQLFAAAQAPGEPQVKNTLAAAHGLALVPGHGTDDVFSLQGKQRYAPALTEAPNDWTMALVYVGSGMNAPGRMAFDADGNIWVINNFEAPGTTPGTKLTVLSPTGEPILGSPITGGGLGGAGYGVTIDQSARVWVGNFAASNVSLFSGTGAVLSPGTGFMQGGISKPQGMATDSQGNIWIANFGGDSVVVYRDGDPSQFEQMTGSGIFNSFSVAIDADDNAWVTNGAEAVARGSVTKIANDGTPLQTIRGGGLRSPQTIAVDQQGNLWVANLLSKSVTLIGPDGRISPLSPIRVNGMGGAWGLSIDGDGNVWVAGFPNTHITLICGAEPESCPGDRETGDPISPKKNSYVSAGLQHLTGIQVDSAGNVWAANNWTTGSSIKEFVGGNGLVELVGAAPPVATPLIGPPASP